MDDPYEEPLAAAVVLDTERDLPAASADRLLRTLVTLGLVQTKPVAVAR